MERRKIWKRLLPCRSWGLAAVYGLVSAVFSLSTSTQQFTSKCLPKSCTLKCCKVLLATRYDISEWGGVRMISNLDSLSFSVSLSVHLSSLFLVSSVTLYGFRDYTPLYYSHQRLPPQLFVSARLPAADVVVQSAKKRSSSRLL